jgi:hypothetical protein
LRFVFNINTWYGGINLRKLFKMLGVALAVSAFFVIVLGGTALAAGYGYAEPAPNSGDNVPDGSGFEGEPGSEISPGPAPNSGDGVPDGSGF